MSNPVARAWVDIVTESTRFVSDRLQQGIEIQQALLRCTTPAEVVQLQTDFFQEALEQYTNKARRLFQIMTEATEDTLKQATPGQARTYGDISL